jgi:hypothetical protein
MSTGFRCPILGWWLAIELPSAAVVGTDGPPGLNTGCREAGRTGNGVLEVWALDGKRMSCEFGSGRGRSGAKAADGEGQRVKTVGDEEDGRQRRRRKTASVMRGRPPRP